MLSRGRRLSRLREGPVEESWVKTRGVGDYDIIKRQMTRDLVGERLGGGRKSPSDPIRNAKRPQECGDFDAKNK